MKKWSFLFIAAGCMAFQPHAYATLPLFCAPPEALLDTAESCAGNGVFVEASKACLAKLNAEETASGKEIDEVAKQAKHGQSTDTSAAREGYTKTVQAMNRLLGLAEQGKAELLAYEPYLALPSNEEASLHTNNGSLNMAGATQASCYADSLREVRATETEFGRKIAMYEARRKEALVAAKALGLNLGNLQAVTTLATPAKGRGSAKPVPAGKSDRSQSQITGKIKDSKLP